MSRGSGSCAIESPLPFGKRVGGAVYLHVSALDELGPHHNRLVDDAMQIASTDVGAFNVVKFSASSERISLLHYEDFFEDGFPRLARSWTVDLDAQTATLRDYAADGNPPILHRKETLLAPDHPMQRKLLALTRAAEEAGLLDSATEIGHRDAWEARLRRVGLCVQGNSLVETEQADADAQTLEEIHRHRTALVRYSLSSPMQMLWRTGFLDGKHTVLDYGCGRGDDVRALAGQGIEVTGWDPFFAPENEKRTADVVNLGFVLNVIEDPDERREALLGAWALTEQVLAVAVLLRDSNYERYRIYRDGVVTARGTFQKHFRPTELREYVSETLGRDPIAIRPGIVFVFKTDDAEQAFLAERQLSRAPRSGLPTVPNVNRPRIQRARMSKWERHREIVEEFWTRCLELGRHPEPDEFVRAGELRENLGTPKTVLRYCTREFGSELLEQARTRRHADRLVYLALNLFERRRSFAALPQAVRRDVKALWGSFSSANAAARDTLFSAGRPDDLAASAQVAVAQGIGYMPTKRALFLHASQAPQLPPLLRIYLGCAARVYGAFEDVDLIKIHIGSNKVSLMTYDDFAGRAVPMLQERIKIVLGNAEFQVFSYGDEFPPQPLLWKSRFIPSDFPQRDKQLAFDEALSALGLVDEEQLTAAELEATLAHASLQIRGFRLTRKAGPKANSPSPPSP